MTTKKENMKTDLDYLLEYVKENGRKTNTSYLFSEAKDYGFVVEFHHDYVVIEAYAVKSNVDDVAYFYITEDAKFIFNGSVLKIESDLNCKTNVIPSSFARNFKKNLQDLIKNFKEKKILDSELKFNEQPKKKVSKV